MSGHPQRRAAMLAAAQMSKRQTVSSRRRLMAYVHRGWGWAVNRLTVSKVNVTGAAASTECSSIQHCCHGSSGRRSLAVFTGQGDIYLRYYIGVSVTGPPCGRKSAWQTDILCKCFIVCVAIVLMSYLQRVFKLIKMFLTFSKCFQFFFTYHALKTCVILGLIF